VPYSANDRRENAMRHRRIALIALAIAAAGAAQAQTGLNRLAGTLDRMQKNFDIADKDRDGLLTREEAKNGPTPFIYRHFDAIDRAHRGQVSKDDVAAYLHSLQRPAPAASSSAR